MKCLICNKDVNTIGGHLKSHNISAKDYYDAFLKTDNDGKCEVCGEATKFKSLNKGYRKFCSPKCVMKSERILTNIKNTCQERYGVDNAYQAKEFQDKAKKTTLERYGVENCSQSEEIKQKKRDTMLKHYGVTNSFSSPELKSKMLKTVADRYNNGVEITNVSQVASIKEKIKNTCNEKYGVDNVFQAEEIKESIKATKLERYGSEYYISCSRHPDYFIYFKEWLESLGLDLVLDNRTIISPYEIDIFIPELKLGFEVNGSFFHSTKHKDKYYHSMKVDLCNSVGVRLIHIYDFEIFNNFDEIKDFILSVVNKTETLPSNLLDRDKYNMSPLLKEFEILEPINVSPVNKFEIYNSGMIKIV